VSKDEEWDEAEIDIAVEQYVEVLKRGGSQRSVSKDVFLARAEKQLPKRNSGSVNRRMCNISHVFVELGGDPVIGWKPLANVGPTNTARIAAALKARGAI
jgi:5-methylcytosine-specific restriction protein A